MYQRIKKWYDNRQFNALGSCFVMLVWYTVYNWYPSNIHHTIFDDKKNSHVQLNVLTHFVPMHIRVLIYYWSATDKAYRETE